MTSIPTLIWLIELYNYLENIIMDLTTIIAILFGAAGYAGIMGYALPAYRRRQAVKSRIAKATATRRANAIKKAVTPEGKS